MAIRLYPDCSIEEMERLAGVPAGTYARFKAYEATRPDVAGPTMDAWYDGLYHDQDLVNLSNFITFGWGRLTTPAMAYKREHFPDSVYAGSTTDFRHAQALIQAMGIVAEGVTSVRWS